MTTTTTTTTGNGGRSAAVAGSRSAGAGAGVTVMAVAGRTVRRYVRSPQLLVFSIVNGAIFMLLFRYIFGGSIDMGEVAYVNFLVPGMLTTSVVITCVGTAVGVAEDVDGGFFDRLRSLPVPRTALAAGRALGDTAIVALVTTVTAALGFLVGFRLQGDIGEAIVGLGLCAVYGFALLWVFICIGLVAGNAQAAQGMTMVVYPLIFTSSAYVRVETLPGWMRAFAEHQPVTAMSNAVRSLALGDPALAGLEHTTTYWVALSLIWAGGIMAVFAALTVARYNRA